MPRLPRLTARQIISALEKVGFSLPVKAEVI